MHLEQVMGGWRSSGKRCMKDVTIYKGTYFETSGYGRIKNQFRIPGIKVENNYYLIKIPEPVRSFMDTHIHTYIHIYMHACIHTYMHACTQTYIHTSNVQITKYSSLNLVYIYR